MYGWNLFLDALRYREDDDDEWGFNGENEFGGYPSNDDLHFYWGGDWGPRDLARTIQWYKFPYVGCSEFAETDVVFNPACSFTFNSLAARDNSSLVYYPAVLMHELGHVLGFKTGEAEDYEFDVPTVMHEYYGGDVQDSMPTIHAPDANLLRAFYADQRGPKIITNFMVVSRYADLDWNDSTTDKPAPYESYTQGETIQVNNLTVENPGTMAIRNAHIRLYLSADRDIGGSGDILLSDYYWASYPSGSWGVYDFTGTIPLNTPPADYWVGVRVSCSGYGSDDIPWDDSTFLYDQIRVKAAAPKGVKASDGTYANHVVVSWNAVPGAPYYRLYRSDSATGEKMGYWYWTTNTSCSDWLASPYVTYYYWVQASPSTNVFTYQSGFSTNDTGWPFRPVVTVTASDNVAGEPGTGLGGGMFTFSRTGPTNEALTVSYTVGGTATSGSDYAAIGTAVNFAVGAGTAAKAVSVIDDAMLESNETVVVTLAAGSYTIGSSASATVTIADDEVATTPPEIFSQPDDATVSEGANANFFVYATGTEPLRFQWRFNGTNLPGPSTNSYSNTGYSFSAYTVANARPSNQGAYTAVITNLYGRVTSSVARLTVTPPPEINVLVGGSNLLNFQHTISFGTWQLGQTSAPVTVTISNSGVGNLNCGAIIGGTANKDYFLDYTGMVNTVPPGSSTSFRVAFCSTAAGTRSAELQIGSNDADESNFFVYLSAYTEGVSVDTNFNVGNLSYSAQILTTVPQTDGRILLGGHFYSINGTNRYHLARVAATGALDANFDPNANDRVNCLAQQPDGKILVAGWFTTLSGAPRNTLARLNADGALDPDFDPNVSGVECLALQPDGKILLAGAFTHVGAIARTNLARLNADGTLDTDFNSNSSLLIMDANSLAVLPDGRILVAGSIQLPNWSWSYLVRLNADGSLDSDFNPSPVLNRIVYCVASQPDGKILIGCNNSFGGPYSPNCLARLNADGTPDTSFALDFEFDPGYIPNGSGVTSLALQADGRILLSGDFRLGGQILGGVGYMPSASDHYYIARLNPDGTLETDFNPQISSASVSYAGVSLQADGKILLGGVRLLNGPATRVLVVTNATQVEWLRGGTAPEVEQVTFEVSTNGGTNWTALGSGIRVTGGWARSDLSLPPSGLIRARGRATAGIYDGSSSLIEQVASYSLLPPPSLAILRATTNAIAVSWPSPSTGWTLQVNTNGVSSVNWSNVTSGIQDDGATKTLIVNPPAGSRWYRLNKP